MRRRCSLALAALLAAAAPLFAQVTGPGVLPGTRPFTAGGVVTSPVGLATGACTAAAESLYWSAQTGEGLANPGGAGTFSVCVNNGERFRFSSAGSFYHLDIGSNAIEFGSALGTRDVFQYRSGAKTIRFDTDGASGNLTDVQFKTGSVTVYGDIISTNGNIKSAVGGVFAWSDNKSSIANHGTDGQFIFANYGSTAGVGFDVTSDSTLWVKTRAFGDNALIKANTIQGTVALAGPGTVAATGDVRLQNATNITYRDSAAADQNLVVTVGTNNNGPALGNTTYSTRIRSLMGTPTVLANGEWWVESDTGGITGAHGLLKARLNGATVTLGGDSAMTTATPADQTGNGTATFKMNGLGAAGAPCTITPVVSGKVIFYLSGDQAQNTTADGVTFKIAFGTGAAPANAAAATGTVIGSTHTWTALTGQLQTGFAIHASTTGLTLGTAVWYDLQIADVTGGTASVKNVTCTAVEM